MVGYRWKEEKIIFPMFKLTDTLEADTRCYYYYYYYYHYYYTALKHSSFGPLLDIGLLIGYKGFSLISFGNDKPLLRDGYARVCLLCIYMQPAWHTRLVKLTAHSPSASAVIGGAWWYTIFNFRHISYLFSKLKSHASVWIQTRTSGLEASD